MRKNRDNLTENEQCLAPTSRTPQTKSFNTKQRLTVPHFVNEQHPGTIMAYYHQIRTPVNAAGKKPHTFYSSGWHPTDLGDKNLHRIADWCDEASSAHPVAVLMEHADLDAPPGRANPTIVIMGPVELVCRSLGTIPDLHNHFIVLVSRNLSVGHAVFTLETMAPADIQQHAALNETP